jgi:hypothetical protein
MSQTPGKESAWQFRRVVSIKESVTYQAILTEGLEEGERRGAIAEAKKLPADVGDCRALGQGAVGFLEELLDLAGGPTPAYESLLD